MEVTLPQQIDSASTEIRDELGTEIRNTYDPWTFDYTWAEETPYITHALGEIDGYTYTNSLEAFEYNYEEGCRVFEVDLVLTDEDYRLVASHGESNWREMTGADASVSFNSDHFLEYPLYGQYTPLTGEDVLRLMAKYPDIYIITDTKETEKAKVLMEFYQLVSLAEGIDATVLDRLIPQIYSEEMLQWIMEIYPFRSVIYTLYQTRWTADTLLCFCHESGIRYVTMPDSRFSVDTLRKLDTMGIRVAVHTVDDRDRADELLDAGVTGIYTDTLGRAE